MSWVAVGIAGASLVGGLISSQGAQNAAQSQAQASQNAMNMSLGEFNTITQQEQPFMQAGYGAMNQLNYLTGNGTPANYATTAWNPKTGMTTTPYNSTAGGFGSLLQPFTTANWQQLSPAYQFQMQQGQQGVLGGDASGMGSLSGAAQKDLMGYNQNLANTSFNNAFNMYQTQQGNIYQRLAGLAQMGQSAAANTGQQGTALIGQAAQSATNIGTAQAGGQVGAANAWSGALSSASFVPWLMSGSGGGAMASDRRLKENIKRVGITASGLPVYIFNYKGSETICMGVMADEVIRKFPEAVTHGDDGFDRVNYGMLE
ncbi:MAG: tail fiber domain-containing protein [Patescibacteria group bacterium]|nr:tail fiber domain-containing protein [Patescibacteria group bacterium]